MATYNSDRRSVLKIVGAIGATCAYPFAGDELFANAGLRLCGLRSTVGFANLFALLVDAAGRAVAGLLGLSRRSAVRVVRDVARLIGSLLCSRAWSLRFGLLIGGRRSPRAVRWVGV